MNPVLSVQNLAVELQQDRRTLVDGIAFDLYAGEILALVGESGSGKSLAALSLMRLLPDAIAIRSGTVSVAQAQGMTENVFALPEYEMNRVRGKRMAMIFQEPQSSLNPVQTVGQQLREVFRLHQRLDEAHIRDNIVSLLQEVGIPDPAQRAHWYPHQLSGGQKQRVMIAMALACSPDILLADEPTTALDVTIQKQILDLLKRLCRERQLAILLITHDMGVVAEVADRVAVMRQGELVEQNSCRDFFARPQHEYSQMLIRALPDARHFLEPTTALPLLSLRKITVAFPIQRGFLQRVAGHTVAVKEVSLDIGQGETLALVGESGCGKTTLGKAVLGLETISSGEMLYYGEAGEQRISHLSSSAFLPWRKKIQIVFQDPYSSMNPRLTVREIIEEGMLALQVQPDSSRRMREMVSLIERVGLLPDHLHRYVHEFSGGQRQRIAIARALAVKPRLLVCDEPTSALDVSLRSQILQLLKQLQVEEGLSYLFITHDLSIIPGLAHRVAVMKDGRIVETGTTRDILTRPQHDYTRSLLAAAPGAGLKPDV
jgi:peptide/nickel transport system ATP-binding protein